MVQHLFPARTILGPRVFAMIVQRERSSKFERKRKRQYHIEYPEYRAKGQNTKARSTQYVVFVQHQPVHRGWKFHTRIPGHFATVLSSLGPCTASTPVKGTPVGRLVKFLFIRDFRCRSYWAFEHSGLIFDQRLGFGLRSQLRASVFIVL